MLHHPQTQTFVFHVLNVVVMCTLHAGRAQLLEISLRVLNVLAQLCAEVPLAGDSLLLNLLMKVGF